MSRHREETDVERPQRRWRWWSEVFLGSGSGFSDRDELRRSRLLSGLVLIMLGSFATVDIIESFTEPGYAVPWGGYALMVGCYALNRMGHFALASWVQMSMFPLVIFTSLILGRPGFTVPDLSYLILGIMLASLLRGFRETALFAGMNLVGIGLLPILFPGAVAAWGLLLTPLTIVLLGTVLVLAISHYRDLQEQDRQEEQRRNEARLRQAEKLEAIGLLAGGVAHDFNNQLSGILGFAEFLREDLADRPEQREYAEQIALAAERSATLTRQLLSFARKGNRQSVMVDLDDLIEELIGLLRHSVDKRIGLLHRRAPAPAVTLGDPAQLQNALLNVAINGRDAMPQGGELEFSVESVQVEDAGRRHVAGTPTVGPYVKVTVRDTGIGMAQEMIASAVEPFFTTKEAGKGTGLGLPAVCGIVDAHGGFMNIESTPGRGTDVMVYLPAEQHVAPDGGGEESAAALPVALRVLVIDDEPAACAVCRIMLSRLGHSVQAFGDSVDALDFYAHQWQSVDVIILDMILPRLSGREVFGALRQINRDARILLCSGFSMDAAARGLLGQGPVGFIGKPFNQQDLSAALSELASQDI